MFAKNKGATLSQHAFFYYNFSYNDNRKILLFLEAL